MHDEETKGGSNACPWKNELEKAQFQDMRRGKVFGKRVAWAHSRV